MRLLKHTVRHTINTVGVFKTFKYKMMLEGAIVGALVGLVIVLFRLGVEKMEHVTDLLLALSDKSFLFIPIWGAMLLFIAMVLTFLVKKEPMISGSGIPQLKADMRGEIRLNWLQVLLCKFVGCTLALGGGLSLGREGPSIQIGGMIGKGFSRVTKRIPAEERFLMSCGAGAGLTAAFNAPIAGAIFCLEELNKSFSEKTLLTAMSATITADFVSSYVFGLKPIFTLKVGQTMPLKYYWLIIVTGVVLGLFGVVFNKTLSKFQDLYKKKFFKRFKIFIPFAMVFVLGFAYPAVIGGGADLVDLASTGRMTIGAMCLLFVVKFVFFMFCFGSGAPGGIFMPMLVFGAVLGGIIGQSFGITLGFGNIYLETFVIVGMAGYFAAIVRAPITGIILISEMTGSLSHLLALSLVSLTAYFVADICRAKPVYDQLLQRILHERHNHPQGARVRRSGRVKRPQA